ncbi:MAG: DUF4124 domain-containing protein [Pseudomonadota bacterium]|jgi:hypothetical protein
MKSMLAVFAVVMLTTAWSASAQKIYKCTNEKGEIYYTQAYDPVRCAGGGAQLNEQGVEVRRIDRIKTPEELATEAAAEKSRAEAERLAAEQREADRILLSAYANEDDIKRAHAQRMQMIDTEIQTAKLQLTSLQAKLAELLAVAAESERANSPVPESIASQIENVRRQIGGQNENITRSETERVTGTAEFESTIARYRELVAAQRARM